MTTTDALSVRKVLITDAGPIAILIINAVLTPNIPLTYINTFLLSQVLQVFCRQQTSHHTLGTEPIAHHFAHQCQAIMQILVYLVNRVIGFTKPMTGILAGPNGTA